MEIPIPHYVERVMNGLIDKGYDTYLVGGSVRDILMNKNPMDWDIASSAEPNEVKKAFENDKVVDTGERYGTVTVICEEGKVEVTTFRSEGGYSDGRHPDWVHFEKNIEKDLSRRDFTVNAIAYNKNHGFIDPFGGAEDICRGNIRAVGNPEDRFLEDGLRMIRAIRFSTNLSFEIEENTINAIKKLAPKIKLVSTERIRDELFKILTVTYPSKGMRLLLETGLIKYILPEIALDINFEHNKPNSGIDMFEHTSCVLDKVPNLIHIRLAALFHNGGKPFASKALLHLKCPNSLTKKVETLVENYRSYYGIIDKIKLKKFIRSIGEENIFDLLSLQKADAICEGNRELQYKILSIENIVKEILDNNEPIYLHDLDIDGNDIKSMGFYEGEIIGRILEDLMEEVLICPELNQKEMLIKIIGRKWM